MLLVLVSVPYSVSSGKTQPLEQWYQYYNQALFDHSLPDNVQIDHQLRDPALMAIIECGQISNGCHISFNPDFELSTRISRFTLIHEMCHVSLASNNEYELDAHGPKWQQCMHQIANRNGFEDLW